MLLARHARLATTALLLTACPLGGCAAPSPAEEGPAPTDVDADAAHVGNRVGANVVSTDRGTIRLLDGYNSLLDDTFASCVTPTRTGEGSSLAVGNVSERFNIRYITSRVELAEELGIEPGIGAKYFQSGLAEINGRIGLGFLQTHRQTNTSVTFLLRAVQSYTVSNLRGVELTREARELLERDQDAFVRRCGDGYVNGIVHTAELAVLIRFDAATEELARELKADLAGGVALADPSTGQGGGVDGNLKTKFVTSARRDGVTANVLVASRGILVSGSTETEGIVPLTSGVTDETFAKIEQLRTAMGRSITDDVCRDGGGGGAEPCAIEPVGYAENAARNARPTAVLLAGYNKAENAPPITDTFNPYRAIQDKLARAENFLRGFAVLDLKMQNAYFNEIAPFVGATAEDRVAYNVAPPGAPLPTYEAVAGTVESWRATFAPNDGVRMGTATAMLHEASAACWKGAKLGDYDRCLASPAESTGAYRVVAAAITEYETTGRVLPLRFAKGKPAVYAAASCKDIENLFDVRLPDRNEVERLAPVVAARARDGKAWYSDTPERCAFAPYFEAGAASSSMADAHKCGQVLNVSSWLQLDTMCVPVSGPFGTIPPL